MCELRSAHRVTVCKRPDVPHVRGCSKELSDIAARLNYLIEAATGSRNPRLCAITDGAHGLQSIAQSLPFSSNSVLDLFHISMRVRYLEQIVKAMRVTTESEKAARRVLVSSVAKLRWRFWHDKLEQAIERMKEILIICRVLIAEGPGAAEASLNLITGRGSLSHMSKQMEDR